MGLGEYSEQSLQTVRGLVEPLRVPLVIERVADHGVRVEPAGNFRMCSVCGAVRRALLDRVGLREGFTAIATGHTLDDRLQQMLKRLLTGRLDAPRPILPGDVFKMKGFIATGTDAKCYRERLAKAWGVYPIEVAAGTESTCLGVETWEHKGMTFFPDACFYEFIPENEMLRNLQDPDYIPKTCLMDEVAADQNYELVISVLKGGAFARYRIGDVYRCLGTDQKNGVPRFTFLDRIPTVIDIAGFTRITEASIDEVIRLSKLGVGAWLAKKEYTEDNNPYLHMYMEVSPDTLATDAITKKVITEHLTVYFKYFDSDYEDLKKLLNIEPLQITLLRYGTIKKYEKQNNCKLPRINPSALDISGLLQNRKGAAAVLATGRGI
jgi:hypothetical protein